MTTIHQVSQRPNAGSLVTLYDLDATAIGGEVYRFTSSSYEDAAITWRGNSYVPVPVESDGWEWNGSGSLPTPTIKLANVNGLASDIVNAHDDLLSAIVVRWRTHRMFLDGQENADPEQYYQLDVYKVERKVSQNKIFLEWELSAAMDQEGKKLPGRQVIRDTCQWRYRTWDGTAFTYNGGGMQCPYTGVKYFDDNGVEVSDPALDSCSQQLTSGCLKRYGNGQLPFGGFTGVARHR